MVLLPVVLLSKNAVAQTQDSQNDPREEVVEENIERNYSIEDFVRGVLSTVPKIIDKTKDVIEDINRGNFGDAIYGAWDLVELIDPQEEANKTTISENSPYSNPELPEEVDRMGQAADVQQSQIIQRLSQIVFSELGQEATKQQNQNLEESQEAASLAQEATVEAQEIAEDIVDENFDFANDIEQEADEARSANASQDVLKAIASQKEYEGRIMTGISEQIALLVESEVYSGVQLKSLNTQLTVLNQREQNAQTFDAAQTLQLAEIDNNLEQQIKLDKFERDRKTLRAQVGMTKVYIPGLYTEEVNNEEEESID